MALLLLLGFVPGANAQQPCPPGGGCLVIDTWDEAYQEHLAPKIDCVAERANGGLPDPQTVRLSPKLDTSCL